MVARWGRGTTIALAVAALWSMVLLVLALFAPAYGTASTGSSEPVTGGPLSPDDPTVVTTSTLSLVEANGWWALVVVSVPLALTFTVGGLLWTRTRPGRVAAWVVAVVLLGLCLLAAMSVGLFMVPAAVALLAACALQRREPGPLVGPTVVEAFQHPR